MPEKRALPSERKGKTFKAKINNNTIYLHTGEYEDGSLGEIFIEMYKEGAGYKSILGCFSICVSWLLQYGVPLEKLVDKFQYTRFEPAGIVTGDKEIKMCTSILDYVFRKLGISYLGLSNLSNVKSTPIDDDDKPHDYTKGPKYPEDREVKGLKEPGAPDINIYTFGSGSMGLKPVGMKAKEFFDYMRLHREQESNIWGKFTLDFDDGERSVVIYDVASNKEEVVVAVKNLFYLFYGTSLDMGDIA